MDDGYALLEQDHRDIEQQLQSFLRDNDQPVVREVCEHLTRHSQMEDAALYPALRRWVDGGDDLADRAQQEHVAIATIVAELYDSTTPERLVERMTDLRDAVQGHVQFEESEIFPAMRESRVDAHRLASDLQSDGPAGLRAS